MKRSQRVVLGLLLSAGVSLAGCAESDPQDEEGYYGSTTHSHVYYNRIGTAYYRHDDNTLRPLPADHPYYAAALREGPEVAAGRQAHRDAISVRRSGFGASASLHVVSAGS